ILPQPSFDYYESRINLYLLLATFFTTTWAGAMWWASYDDSSIIEMNWWWLRILISPQIFFMGFLTFSLPLMLILGAHEMGHYYYAKKHNLDASLPFFLPMPPMIFPFGTMGAFISIREPIPNRKALLDVGASGPIAGLLVAIPVTLLGFWLTEFYARSVPVDSGDSLFLGSSFFFELLFSISENLNPSSGDYLSHPVVLAGWTGFFVTALNLMPAGQLDGGHIARSLLGPKANILSFVVIISLIFMTFYGIPGFGPPYMGWAIYALLIYFLGTYHPPPSEEISSLGSPRIFVGLVTGLILFTTFTPSPIFTVDSPFSLDIDSDESDFYQYSGETNLTSIRILNNGQEDGWENLSLSFNNNMDNVTVSIVVDFINLSSESQIINETSDNFKQYVFYDAETNSTLLNLSSGNSANLTLTITTLENSTFEDSSFVLSIKSRTEDVYSSTFYLYNRDK
ncbi:MAG: site-2 protease family protein, partial [Candidatus Poseidoniales archaeon]